MNQRLWYWATSVVFTGTLALSINVSAFQQPVPQVFHRDGSAAPQDKSVEAIPLSMPKTTRLSIQSPSQSLTAGGVNGAEAIIYENENFSGFGIFRNFNPTTGLSFPGTLLADNMGLGNGFSPGGRLSSYDLTVFRSILDPQPGLADFHVELWDGDPFCSVDTPGGGFSCTPIAGTEADFVGLPANFVTTLRAVLPGNPIAPNTAVWMALSTSETANPAPCRLGWIISSLKPTIGNDQDFDVWEDQRDSDSETNGGTCCIDGLACGGADPPCAFCASTGVRCVDDVDCPAGDTCFGGATDGNRLFCSDGDAEDANSFFFGGPCTGDRTTDFCATFMASVFAPAEVSMTLQPVGTAPNGALDPGARIVGNEIIMEHGGTRVFMEVKISDFDVVDTFCVGGSNDGAACTSDADCPDLNGCSNALAVPCTVDADCAPGQGFCKPLDPGSCGTKLGAYQANILQDGFASGLQGTLTLPQIACATNQDCVVAFGGLCSLVAQPCTVDADCPLVGGLLPQTCESGGPAGPFCDTFQGQCVPAFIFGVRPDFIFANATSVLSAAAVPYGDGSPIRIAAVVVDPVKVDELDPFPPDGAYAGSLALDVPANARGTFAVQFEPLFSQLLNHRNKFIPLIGFVPAKVTVETGACCDLGTGGCIGNTFTRNECEAMGPLFVFNLNKTCADTICQCVADADCNDNDACTDDVCDLSTGACSNNPLNCNDGIACTDDSCDSTTGCVNQPNDTFCPDDGLFCNGKEFCNAATGCDRMGSPCGGVCDEVGDVCLCDPPVAVAVGDRYLKIIPQSPVSGAQSIVITPDCPGGVPLVVCPPKAVDINRDGLVDANVAEARPDCGSANIFLTSAQWGDLFVFGKDIVPGRSYIVQGDCGSPGVPGLSSGVTAQTPIFGDTVGIFENGMWTPPDGDVDILDLLGVVSTVRNDLGAAPLWQTDLAGMGQNGIECLPDQRTRLVFDALAAINAFGGRSYESTTRCQVPCP